MSISTLKHFRIIDVEEVSKTLDTKTEVYACVLNVKNRIITGGDFIKQNVYQLHYKMSYEEVLKFKEEQDVVFFVLKTEEDAKNEESESVSDIPVSFTC